MPWCITIVCLWWLSTVLRQCVSMNPIFWTYSCYECSISWLKSTNDILQILELALWPPIQPSLSNLEINYLNIFLLICNGSYCIPWTFYNISYLSPWKDWISYVMIYILYPFLFLQKIPVGYWINFKSPNLHRTKSKIIFKMLNSYS